MTETTTFEPTTARGKDLRDLVLAHIRAQTAGEDTDRTDTTHAGNWNQGTWGDFDMDKVEALGAIPDGIDWAHATADEMPALDPATAHECGTAFCFAGHTVLAVGDRPIVDRLGGVNQVITADTGERLLVSERAADLLDLDLTEAGALFGAHNTLDDLEQILARVDTGESVTRCVDCEELPWNCHEGGQTCSVCGLHESDCECCECCDECCECCDECGEHPCECCGGCDRAPGECECDDED